jgi:hypothetical protein
MQPDQWPKYKYLLLELWKPSNPTLLEAVLAERTKCRSEVVSALHKFYLTDFCRETQKLEDNLNHDEREQVIEKTMTAYNGLLRALGGDLITKTFLKRSISVVSAAAASDPEADQPGPEVSASDL